jgi:ribosomal protein S19E (S16A)
MRLLISGWTWNRRNALRKMVMEKRCTVQSLCSRRGGKGTRTFATSRNILSYHAPGGVSTGKLENLREVPSAQPVRPALVLKV